MKAIFLLCILASTSCHIDARPQDPKTSGKEIVKKKPTKPQIYYLHVTSSIQSRFATTLVTSKVINPTDAAAEVVFSLQLPANAFISNFSMLIDGQVIVGDVKEKEAAKQQYEIAVSKGQSAGLVEQNRRDTNQFDTSVNVASHSQVIFNLTYQEVLQRVQGVYKHIININPGQIVDDMQVNVFIAESAQIDPIFIPQITEKTGEQTNAELLKGKQAENVNVTSTISKDASEVYVNYSPNQKSQAAVSRQGVSAQLVVLYDVKRDQSAGQIEVVNGYFVQFFAPDGLPKGNKRVIFVLDISGSMGGTKIAQMRDAMQTILNETNEKDLFNIITFADEAFVWQPEILQATKKNIAMAQAFVKTLDATSGTNIYDSSMLALELLNNTATSVSLANMVVFLTDGVPTSGNTNREEIIDDIARKNPNGAITIHCISFGTDADYDLLQKMAVQNRGVARKVYIDSDAAIQLAGFYNEISSPLLTNLKIVYVNETVLPESLVQNAQYTYYDGSEIMVMGKLNPDMTEPFADGATLGGSISGVGQSGEASYPIDHFIPCYIRCPVYDVAPCDNCATPPRFTCGCPPYPRPIPVPVTTPSPLPVASVGGFIERMWAYQTIQNLLKKGKYGEKNTTVQASLMDQALALSLKYNFVTELTSMVVTLPGNSSTVSDNAKVDTKDADAYGNSAMGFGGPVFAVAPMAGSMNMGPGGFGGVPNRIQTGGASGGGAFQGFPGRPGPAGPPPPLQPSYASTPVNVPLYSSPVIFATSGTAGSIAPTTADTTSTTTVKDVDFQLDNATESATADSITTFVTEPPTTEPSTSDISTTLSVDEFTTTMLTTTPLPTPCYRLSQAPNLFNVTFNYFNGTASSEEECAEQCFFSSLCSTALYNNGTCQLSYQDEISECASVDETLELATEGNGYVIYCFSSACDANGLPVYSNSTVETTTPDNSIDPLIPFV